MQEEASLTPLGRAMVLGTLTIAASLYAMTIMIVSVVLPQVQGSLSATQDQISWTVTFNLVATAVATPMTGWLVGRFGRRKLMLGCLAGFTAVTIACGAATSLGELVVWRILQGALGAPIVPLSQAIVLDTYPKHQHAAAQSVFGMGVVVAPVFGPTLGGYLAEIYNWRAAFYMIAPLSVFAFLGVWAVIRDRAGELSRPFDWTGFAALSAAVVCCQLMLDRGERLDWFDSPEIIVEAIGALVGFYVFVAHSLTTRRPFLDLRLLLDRNYALGLLLVLLYGMLNFTPMILLPPLLQGVMGFPDSIIGELLAARGVGAVMGFFMAMWIGRLDPRVGITFGFLLLAASGWDMSTFDPNVGFWRIAANSVTQGIAIGIIWVPLSVATFATLDRRHLPEATAVFHLLRNFGSSLFIAVSVVVVLRTSKVNYAGLVEHVSPYNEALAFPWSMGLWDAGSLAGLARLGGEIQRQSLMIGYVNAFWLYMAASLVVILPGLLVRRAGSARAA
jgi:MFS transporter, DHA2 family, multidrug resistance protein